MNLTEDDTELEKTRIYNKDEREAYKKNMNILRQASLCGSVVKGLKETIKAIESHKAKVVYLANECELEDYKKVIREFCGLFMTKLIIVNDWRELRDILIKGIPSSILEENAIKKGKTLRLTPKCYSAAILEFGDINNLNTDLS